MPAVPVGIVPVSWLLERSSEARAVREVRAEGMEPVSELPLISSEVKAVRRPN